MAGTDYFVFVTDVYINPVIHYFINRFNKTQYIL